MSDPIMDQLTIMSTMSVSRRRRRNRQGGGEMKLKKKKESALDWW